MDSHLEWTENCHKCMAENLSIPAILRVPQGSVLGWYLCWWDGKAAPIRQGSSCALCRCPATVWIDSKPEWLSQIALTILHTCSDMTSPLQNSHANSSNGGTSEEGCTYVALFSHGTCWTNAKIEQSLRGSATQSSWSLQECAQLSPHYSVSRRTTYMHEEFLPSVYAIGDRSVWDTHIEM